MLRLEVVDNEAQHFIVSWDEPCRVEVSVVGGVVIARFYRGDQVNPEQYPDLVFIGGERNRSCTLITCGSGCDFTCQDGGTRGVTGNESK